MDRTDEIANAEGLAGHAFEQLCGEVSLLRQGVETLTAERQAAPDHGPALTGIAQRIDALTAGVQELAEQPAMELTPAALAEEIERAGEVMRARDRTIIKAAGDALSAVTVRIERSIQGARDAGEQERAIHIWSCCALLFGMNLMQALNDIDRALRATPAIQTATPVRSSPLPPAKP